MTRLHTILNARLDRAIFEYQMIRNGDRIMVAVSGGNDSMALLELLSLRLPVYGDHVSLYAVYVDMGFGSEIEARLEQMQQYLAGQRIEGYVERTDYGPYAHSEANRENPCFLCSRLRRKRLFEMAEKYGANKIAFGHHKDDIIETLFLNMIYSREISTMPPQLAIFQGKYQIIRPLVYIEEKLLKSFAYERRLPVIENPCPSAGHSKRAWIKNILSQMEETHKGAKDNIFNAMRRVKLNYLLNQSR